MLDQDEGDDAHPVPNGNYDNTAGFTHDYYFGTTGLATDPTQCLGVTPDSWAMGGPVTMPTRTLAVPARELGVAVTDLVDRAVLTRKRAAVLQRLAGQASVELRDDHPRRAQAGVREFIRLVNRMRQHRHLDSKDARVLAENAALLRSQLTAR